MEARLGQTEMANDFYHEGKSETESAYFVIQSPNESFMKQLSLTKGVTQNSDLEECNAQIQAY